MSAVARPLGGGILLRIRLTPKSAREAVGTVWKGPDGDWLQARVRAIPEDGRANEALIALLGRTLGVPASAIRVASGHTARLKSVEVAGDPAVLMDRVAALMKGMT